VKRRGKEKTRTLEFSIFNTGKGLYFLEIKCRGESIACLEGKRSSLMRKVRRLTAKKEREGECKSKKGCNARFSAKAEGRKKSLKKALNWALTVNIDVGGVDPKGKKKQ